MTPTTETILFAWLFLLTVAVIALFAGWMSHRGTVFDMAKLLDGMVMQLRTALETLSPPAKPSAKRQRRSSKADIPISLVPTTTHQVEGRASLAEEKGHVIDLSTPLAERTLVAPGDIVFIEHPCGERVSGVGGTKPDGNDPEAA
jgi:hypothetical protein